MYTDPDETKEVQEKRIEYFKKKVTDSSRATEEELRLRLFENKVNGPEDAVVSEMIKQLPLEKIYIITRCFQERFMDHQVRGMLWNWCSYENQMRNQRRGQKFPSHRAGISDVQVVRILFYSSSGKEKELECWKTTRGKK